MGTHRASMSRRPDASAPAADTASSSPTSPPAEKRDRRRRARKTSTPDHLRKTPESTPAARGSPPTPREPSEGEKPAESPHSAQARPRFQAGPVFRSPENEKRPAQTQTARNGRIRAEKRRWTAPGARFDPADDPQRTPPNWRPLAGQPLRLASAALARLDKTPTKDNRCRIRQPSTPKAPPGPGRQAGSSSPTSPAAEQRARRRRARKATDRHQHTGRQPSRVWIPANEQQCSNATRSQPRQPTPPADRPGEAPLPTKAARRAAKAAWRFTATHAGQSRQPTPAPSLTKSPAGSRARQRPVAPPPGSKPDGGLGMGSGRNRDRRPAGGP